MDSSSVQSLVYSKPIHLAIKGLLAAEKTVTPVTFTIRHAGGGVKSSTLEVELTQEQDPLFLYCLSVGEEEFHQLKTEQTLLVDFGTFPAKLVELIQLCILHQGDDYPKYIAQLLQDATGNLWTLSIIETNSFKHITHISLKFTPGNDYTTKTHLACVVRELKDQLSKSCSSLAETKENLALSKNAMEKGRAEMDSLRHNHQEEKNALILAHAHEIAKEREKFMTSLEESRKGGEQEGKTIRAQYENQARAATEQLTTLQAIHKETAKNATSLEAKLSTTQEKLASLTAANLSINQEKERLLSNKAHLEQTLKSCNEKYENISLKLRESEKLEQASMDKRVKLEEKLEFVQSQMKREQDSVALLKVQSDRLEGDFRLTSEDLSKANDIIRKLQADLKLSKNKAKMKNVVALQQEKSLEEKSVAVDSLTKELASTREAHKVALGEVGEKDKKIVSLVAAIDESKKVIDDNNHVIDWLHKQLNEDALHRPPKQPFAPIDFNKFSGGASETSAGNHHHHHNSSKSKYTQQQQGGGGIPGMMVSDTLKHHDFSSPSRPRYTSMESSGAGGGATGGAGFERASPIPAASLAASRNPSAFSSHNIPSRNKSPTNSAYHHFNVGGGNSNKPLFTKQQVPGVGGGVASSLGGGGGVGGSTSSSNVPVYKPSQKSTYF